MEDNQLSLKPTLARRVSDLFKDRKAKQPKRLFSQSSMQKLRHCCQNLNLFPYLLYSLGDAKNTTSKLAINQIIAKFSERIFQLYLSLRLNVHTKLQLGKPRNIQKSVTEVREASNKEIKKFLFEKQKKKEISILLVAAIYLAPIILVLQLIGITSLLLFGKYTPGFIFLLSALLFLGYISMKVLFHNNDEGIKETCKKKN